MPSTFILTCHDCYMYCNCIIMNQFIIMERCVFECNIYKYNIIYEVFFIFLFTVLPGIIMLLCLRRSIDFLVADDNFPVT